MDDFRVTRGAARYTANFTAPDAVFPDVGTITESNFSSVVSLLHFNGTDGASTFTDEKGKTWTVGSGSPVTEEDQSKFGWASLYISAGAYIYSADSADWDPGTSGDYTVEFWVRPSGVSGIQFVVGNRNSDGTGWEFIIDDTSCYIQASSSFISSAASTIAANTWHHIAWSKTGSTSKLYVNGVEVASGTLTVNDSAYTCVIGKRTWGTEYAFTGYVDDLRITKGVARYTAAFSVPTEPYPNANT
jgi:hypothetical protein